MRVVMDADALIKVTKASVKDLITSNIEVFVPGEVEREAVREGKSKGYPDSLVVEDNIREGKIVVVQVGEDDPTERLIIGLQLHGGEADSLRLFKRGSYDAITSDDQRFLDLVDGLGIPYTTPMSLLIYLWRTGRITRAEARKWLEKLRELVSAEEYLTSMEELRGE